MTEIALQQQSKQPESIQRPFLVPLPKVMRSLIATTVILFFCQIWLEIGGFTLRLEDIITLFMVIVWLYPTMGNFRIKYQRNSLNLPLFIWGVILIIGLLVTLSQPFPATIKKDAIVNTIRLVLALSLFFTIYNFKDTANNKTRLLINLTIGFSLVTTCIALIQMAFWDGWLNISLPSFLTEFKQAANTSKGREIFALFIGNTGTHVWSAMLSLQLFTVYSVAKTMRKPLRKYIAYLYCGLLLIILVRTSVRNSILGVFFSLGLLEVYWARRSRFQVNRLMKPFLIAISAFVIVAVILIASPESYFVERIRQTIPEIQGGKIVVDRGSNINGRLLAAEAAIGLFLRSPIFGSGFWSYDALSDTFMSASIPHLTHAHNIYLHILAEYGVIGMIGMTWLLWRLLNFTFMFTKSSLDDFYFHVTKRLWFTSFVFFCFTGLFATPLIIPKQFGYLMLLLAISMTWSREIHDPRPKG